VPEVRRIALLIATALVAGALGGGLASGSTGPGPSAGASAAHCSGKAFSPTQTGNLLRARGTLTCRGDVAKQRLRTCLEQFVPGRGFITVRCKVKVRSGPGRLVVRARRACRRGAAHAFRTRSFLFLRDRSGKKARGRAVSDRRVYPRSCT
jgi:hypothetical protein